MEVIGNSAPAAAAARSDALPAGPVPEAVFPGAVVTLDALPADWFNGEVFPFDDFAGEGFVHDDDLDAAVPEDPFPGGEYPDGIFPEDPFPESLFYDSLLTVGGAPAVGSRWPSLNDRLAGAQGFLKADLTADSPGLIDQIRAGENIKAMIAGQQARLAVEFEARQRQVQAELEAKAGPAQTNRSALAAEDLGNKRPKDRTMGVAEQIALAGASPRTAAAGSSGWPRPWSPKCPTPRGPGHRPAQ